MGNFFSSVVEFLFSIWSFLETIMMQLRSFIELTWSTLEATGLVPFILPGFLGVVAVAVISSSVIKLILGR